MVLRLLLQCVKVVFIVHYISVTILISYDYIPKPHNQPVYSPVFFFCCKKLTLPPLYEQVHLLDARLKEASSQHVQVRTHGSTGASP